MKKLFYSFLSDNNRKLKKNVLALVKNRLIKTFEDNKLMYDVSYAYENRNKNIYVNDTILVLVKWLEKNWVKRDSEYLYSIWGLTQASEAIYSYIKNNYPNSQLVSIYDSFKTVSFMGLKSESPELIKNIKKKMLIFVTATGAVPVARNMERKINNKNIKFGYNEIIK